MPNLPQHLLNKWHYDHNRRLITAIDRVTNEAVEDVLEAAADMGVCRHICIYSGVHGVPGGLLQIDDPQFYETDLQLAQDGAFTIYDPRIEVFKMPLENVPPIDLEVRVRQPFILVILAWCYSHGYI